MTSAERRKAEKDARELGADHRARGFALAIHGGWPAWKVAAYTEGWKEAAGPEGLYRKKALQKLFRRRAAR